MLDGNEQVVHTRGTPDLRVDKRRRIPGQPKKGFEVSQMLDIYQEVIRRIVIGQKNVAIANELGITPQTVSYIRNSEIVQAKLGVMHAAADHETISVAARIKELAPEALKIVETLVVDGKLDGEKIPAKLRAHHAESLLDRAGYAPAREVRSMNLHGHYTKDDIEALKKRARENASAVVVEIS